MNKTNEVKIPVIHTPSAMEQLAIKAGEAEAVRENRRRSGIYARAVAKWVSRIWAYYDPEQGELPIPEFRVEGYITHTTYGWSYGSKDTTDFLSDMWTPDEQMKIQMSDEQLDIAGLTRPDPPDVGTIAVGDLLPDGRYVALPTDTVEDGKVIDHEGMELRRVIRGTPFGFVGWYVVVKREVGNL